MITSWPSERIRISLYHGWSLYIRAAAHGTLIVTVIFVTFGSILPAVGLYIGELTGWRVLPDTNIFTWVSRLIENTPVLRLDADKNPYPALDIASISITAIFITWVATKLINFVFYGNTKLSKAISRSVGAKRYADNCIENLYTTKSPIEHQLFLIMRQGAVDILYNDYIAEERREVYNAIVEGEIPRKNKDEMKEIFEALRYRELNYALVTLENGKFYIGLPTVLPDPDEESVTSSSIRLIPVMSGYRNEKQILVFTTEYDFDVGATQAHDCISIPRDKILTVSGFRFGTHDRIKLRSESHGGRQCKGKKPLKT